MSKVYTYQLDSNVFIDINDSWSRKSITRATTGVSKDLSETINNKFENYCLRLDNGDYVSKDKDFDVEDVDILVLRWMYKCVVEHIDFLLK